MKWIHTLLLANLTIVFDIAASITLSSLPCTTFEIVAVFLLAISSLLVRTRSLSLLRYWHSISSMVANLSSFSAMSAFYRSLRDVNHLRSPDSDSWNGWLWLAALQYQWSAQERGLYPRILHRFQGAASWDSSPNGTPKHLGWVGKEAKAAWDLWAGPLGP